MGCVVHAGIMLVGEHLNPSSSFPFFDYFHSIPFPSIHLFLLDTPEGISYPPIIDDERALAGVGYWRRHRWNVGYAGSSWFRPFIYHLSSPLALHFRHSFFVRSVVVHGSYYPYSPPFRILTKTPMPVVVRGRQFGWVGRFCCGRTSRLVVFVSLFGFGFVFVLASFPRFRFFFCR
ncbi:hypothetical protein FA15DRAFT_432447 [Coprinopsis marcescibilis]|uniref:Transmembrane protein n=1 Tax=Coprinopsis marcescibilis TaxID=230819 RepID=A0A5C3KUE6_COPMA|nr:hypothetical protein FA15DRAFT_432447 [Coprinopsis marcescibilis]